jgi:hypothetical protein
MFTLQHIGQAIDDAEAHHIVGECGGKNTYSPSIEGLLQMDKMEYKRSSNHGV